MTVVRCTSRVAAEGSRARSGGSTETRVLAGHQNHKELTELSGGDDVRPGGCITDGNNGKGD